MCRIIAILLLVVPALAAADWQQQLQQSLLQQWQQVGGDANNSAVSLISASSDYQLPNCNQTLQFSPSRALQPGRNGVTISCASPWWQQFVAVQLHVYETVAILTQAVNSGDVVDPSSIHFGKQDLGELSQGYIASPQQLQQQEYRRNLRAGTVLSPDMLRAAEVIQRGELVRIRLERGSIRIETRGEALSDGRIGETIRVRNLKSGKIISASVDQAGEVVVR
ncbi:flagellar basal body P-ring formation chaperone FlgA [Oceanobacter mangrovi]|uniref:flagellar basal body P-ring formation chaperone FlgA n=1 Tax=Oceanobacter mangrovi TaxID=2862510 RepID=UPI001C8D4AD0|nr:flagellar basal body P-ring formation chaperone FlgA [Oceanobacter mangrovi]